MAYDDPAAPSDDLSALVNSLLDKNQAPSPEPISRPSGLFGSAGYSAGGSPGGAAPDAPAASPSTSDTNGPDQSLFQPQQNPLAVRPLAPMVTKPLSAWDVIPHMIGGKSAPEAAAAAQAQQAQSDVGPPPLRPQSDHMGDVLDSLFTGGAFRMAREHEYDQQARNYEARRAYAVGMSIQNPDERALYFSNPAAWSEVKKSQQEDKLMKGGETRESPGGGSYTANTVGLDPATGRGYAINGTGGLAVSGVNTGPTYNDKGLDTRSGGQVPVASSPVIPAGSRPWNVVTPGNRQPGFSNTASSASAVAGQPAGSVQSTPGLDGDLAALGIAPGGSAATTPPAGPLGMKGRDYFKKFTGKFEGGLNPADMNGAPTNFGFNQSANPDIDVTKLNPATAAQRFEDTYYKRSGAANLPAPLGIVHADTYFRNPGVAKKLLAQSDGDPQKYLDGLSQWQEGIIANNPNAAKYAPAWRNRVAALAQGSAEAAGGSSGAPDGSGAAPNASGSSLPDGFTGGAAVPLGTAVGTRLLGPGDPRLKSFAPGAAVQEKPDGTLEPTGGFTPEVVDHIRDSIAHDPAYSEYAGVVPLVKAIRQSFQSPSAAADLNGIEAASSIRRRPCVRA
jgi:hypothetical protein